jgi:CHAT domain-containing protein/Tfp pilus assembly protein PilF
VLGGCGSQDRAAAGALYNRGREQIRLGNLKEAEALAARGVRDWQAQPTTLDHWRFRFLTAEVLLAQGKPKDALPWLEGNLPSGAGFDELAARRLLSRGFAGLMLSDPAAPGLLEEAGRRARAGGFDTIAAEVEMRRGAVFARSGDTESAARSFLAARAIAVRRGDAYLHASAVGNLGANLLLHSRFDEAVPYFEQSLALSRQGGARALTAATLGNLGRCYYGLGDYDRATDLLGKAESMARELGDDYRRQLWLGDLGDSYAARGQLERAIASHKQALELARHLGERVSIGLWLCGLAEESLASGALDAADAYSRELLALVKDAPAPGIRSGAPLVAGQIALARGDRAAAESRFRQVLALTSDNEDRKNLWAAQEGLARLHAAAGRPERAETFYRAALATIERSRASMPRSGWKLSFHASSMRSYRDYVDFLMERGASERALEVAEFARARILAQKLGIEQTLARPIPAARFRATAREQRAALVSFWLAPRRSFVWIVTADRIRSFVLPGEAELATLVTDYQAAIQALRDPLRTAHPAGLRLAGILLTPIRQSVPAGARIVVVPDGALHELNLETLPVPAPHPHYWLEDATLAVAPSLAVLDASTAEAAVAPGPRSLLWIGNSRPPEKDLPPLPAVEKELAAIRTRLAGWEQTVLTGAAARPAAYREAGPARFSLIHFSAHAAANYRDPLDSAVILSAQGESYKLYAREIVALPIQARLVTISACRGAGSRVYSGEGLVGFAWAFLQAGAKNVIAGLWEVNDASTAALMDTLYARLAAGQAPAPALREAKLALIRSGWAKPYYWAPFENLSRSRPF